MDYDEYLKELCALRDKNMKQIIYLIEEKGLCPTRAYGEVFPTATKPAVGWVQYRLRHGLEVVTSYKVKKTKKK